MKFDIFLFRKNGAFSAINCQSAWLTHKVSLSKSKCVFCNRPFRCPIFPSEPRLFLKLSPSSGLPVARLAFAMPRYEPVSGSRLVENGSLLGSGRICASVVMILTMAASTSHVDARSCCSGGDSRKL